MAIGPDALLKYRGDELEINTSSVGADAPRLVSLL